MTARGLDLNLRVNTKDLASAPLDKFRGNIQGAGNEDGLSEYYLAY